MAVGEVGVAVQHDGPDLAVRRAARERDIDRGLRGDRAGARLDRDDRSDVHLRAEDAERVDDHDRVALDHHEEAGQPVGVDVVGERLRDVRPRIT